MKTMGILDSILKEQGGAVIGQLAKNFGINEKMAEAAIRELAPSIARGIQNNTRNDKGMGSLLDALKRDQHDKHLDDLGSLGTNDFTKEGNDVLGHIFGNNKDVSRNTAGYASEKTGVSTSILKKMLPVVAMIVMGMMSRKGRSSGYSRQKTGGLLTSFLDMDRDGSVLDDVLSMAVRYI